MLQQHNSVRYASFCPAGPATSRRLFPWDPAAVAQLTDAVRQLRPSVVVSGVSLHYATPRDAASRPKQDVGNSFLRWYPMPYFSMPY